MSGSSLWTWRQIMKASLVVQLAFLLHPDEFWLLLYKHVADVTWHFYCVNPLIECHPFVPHVEDRYHVSVRNDHVRAKVDDL